MAVKCFSNYKMFLPDGSIVGKSNKGFLVENNKFTEIGIDVDRYCYENECAEMIDLGGKLVLPGLIDCHTHIVYAGNRAGEFEQRANGATYEEIIRGGGGIYSTIKKTQEASLEQLFIESSKRAEKLKSEGVTTIEIKSGYGLEFEHEKKQLQVAKMIENKLNIDVTKTFLIHVPPKNQKQRAWLEQVVNDWIPALQSADLIDMVDIFCDSVAFTKDSLEYVFTRLHDYNIPVKAHIDQLSHTNAASLACELGALSLEHLEYSSEKDIEKMAEYGVVAVLLPGAFYYLKSKTRPAIDLLRKYGVDIAVATDANPGSSPINSLLCAANLASNLFDLNINEVTNAITVNAAKALGKENEVGSIQKGMKANFVAYDIQELPELFYSLGHTPTAKVYNYGQLIV
ncbi:MAG: imidazolonepropionase [Francisellaceae bacterium]|nr:imidazolonepropionase [Francisellaceae bacterium]MBT6539173.1 imidazolonepropionase [Francisellaceae bacterium]